MPHELDWLWRAIAFPFVDWANSPSMLRLELRRPWLYRAIVWPPFLLLMAALSVVSLWLLGVVKL